MWEITPWNGGETPCLLVTTGKEESAGINTIGVDSLGDALSRVNNAVGKTVDGTNKVPGVGMQVYCADPEENLFGLMQSFEQNN